MFLRFVLINHYIRPKKLGSIFDDSSSDDSSSSSDSGIGAALLGGAIGYASGQQQADAAEYAADKNYEATQSTNNTQLELYKQQREYDYAKWKELLAYNTPSNQVQRYRDAGINPALALSNIDSGSVSSSAGGQSVPNLQTPSIDIGSYSQAHASKLQGLMSGLQQGSNAVLTQKQISSANTENIKALAQMRDSIDLMHEDYRTKKLYNDFTDATLQDVIQTTKEQRRQSQLQTGIMALTQVGSEFDVGLKRFDLLHLKPLEEQTLSQGLAYNAAQISLMSKQGRLTLQQIDESINRVAQSWSQVGVQWFNAKTQRSDSLNQQWNRNQETYRQNKLFPLVKQQLKLGVDMLNKDNNNYWLNKAFGYTTDVLGTISKFRGK